MLKTKEKTMHFGVSLMRSPVLYRAAQGCNTLQDCVLTDKHEESLHDCKPAK